MKQGIMKDVLAKHKAEVAVYAALAEEETKRLRRVLEEYGWSE